jgi:hypothetical protein
VAASDRRDIDSLVVPRASTEKEVLVRPSLGPYKSALVAQLGPSVEMHSRLGGMSKKGVFAQEHIQTLKAIRVSIPSSKQH